MENRVVSKVRAMPVLWAVVLASLCLALGLGWGGIVGYAVAHRPEAPKRCWVDTARLPIDGEIYSVRYIDDSGFPRQIQVEGPEARARVEQWARR